MKQLETLPAKRVLIPIVNIIAFDIILIVLLTVADATKIKFAPHTDQQQQLTTTVKSKNIVLMEYCHTGRTIHKPILTYLCHLGYILYNNIHNVNVPYI